MPDAVLGLPTHCELLEHQMPELRSQVKRAYYLDMPARYEALNRRFPRIHVKQFGEFFHETTNLTD